MSINSLNVTSQVDDRSINLDQLYKKRISKEKTRVETYQEIYKKLIRKIQYVNNYQEDTELIFSPPAFVPGKPLFDTRSCIAFLMFKLKKKGFIVSYTYPNILYVSWKIDPKDFPSPNISNNDNRNSRIERPSFTSFKEMNLYPDDDDEEDYELEQLISRHKTIKR